METEGHEGSTHCSLESGASAEEGVPGEGVSKSV